jgi:hypothetical protein
VEGVRLKDYGVTPGPETLPGGIINSDPLFNDWRKGDYRFQTGSPAAQLGLRPIDVSRAGPRVGP